MRSDSYALWLGILSLGLFIAILAAWSNWQSVKRQTAALLNLEAP
jgi:hypothetical protein